MSFVTPLSNAGSPTTRLRRPVTFVVAAALSALVMGVPTDVVDTPFFTRMTPVRWWEVPVLVLTALLTAVWWAMPRPPSEAAGPGGARMLGSTVLSGLAIGCPVCNKVIVATLGVSGALGTWAPLQPFVALLSLGLAATGVFIRRRACHGGACTAPPVPIADTSR